MIHVFKIIANYSNRQFCHLSIDQLLIGVNHVNHVKYSNVQKTKIYLKIYKIILSIQYILSQSNCINNDKDI